MQRLAFAHALVLGIFLSAHTRAEEPAAPGKHLFILSGQSNMVGMKTKSGFEPEADKLFGKGEYGFFKVASGGKPIRLWVEQWGDIAKSSGIEVTPKLANTKTVYYGPILEQYKKWVAENGQPTGVTFCWMQGERDAREKLSAAYKVALQQLVKNLRTDLNQPKMHFVIGRLSDFGKQTDEHWQAVRNAQVDVAQSDALGAWVDCDDLNDKEKNGVKRNDLHYTAEGYALLGRRYVRQAQRLQKGENATNGRPE